MRRVSLYGALLLFLSFSLLACSQSSPVELGNEPPAGRAVDETSHGLWGYYRLAIDPAAESIEFVPLRGVELHANVKPFVTAPACNDCLNIQVLFFSDNVLHANVTLKNPQPLTGYDIRGILISDDPGVWLVTPDDYTGLYDNGPPVTINPFRSFSKLNPDRSFGPGESYTEHYDIHLDNFGKVTTIDYAIDASWPGRAKEPYQIDTPIIGGEIDDQGNNVVLITVDVLSAGDNVNEVWFDCSSMGFAGELPLTHATGNTWTINFQNTPKAAEGVYTCMVRASTSTSGLYLYDYFTITVVKGAQMVSFANDVQPIWNSYCLGCHDGDEPPDLSQSKAWSELVNAPSAQSSVPLVTPFDPGMSYNQAKMKGIHKDAPFNGVGKQMPWFPPYPSQAEIDLIDLWITQGALNN